ncbi:hypothetical protein EMIHUDRAFT_250399 [Emiliania huxleyi CCMP1516]|uniref:EF-hand domain-containing protein n=2 Tax=Emiliania huxleyi TaxID=2903 RepID=A0A0D3I0W8_EMIH1|nr:hypothetical protein EMIHUDRAFT_250399 [Emiliania huxleyi CCMP1516]EOD04903.1 hypothetical protein EMIHUDRAFT_250399 [Emiliania huxleyi CCMP1516]|eukprot:XP_005757332.1 hypothetical protein EMIHUDRAFT_250399 [Emiliania huxleyi CCMP1516]
MQCISPHAGDSPSFPAQAAAVAPAADYIPPAPSGPAPSAPIPEGSQVLDAAPTAPPPVPPMALNRKQSVELIWSTIDKNGDGKVSKRDMKTAIKAHGPEFKERLGLKRLKDVNDWFDLADYDRDGMVSARTFDSMLEKQENKLNPPKNKR